MKRVFSLLLLALAMTGAFYEWGGPARRGVRELKEGRYDDAMRHLEAGRADMPGQAVIPYDQGLAFLGKGDADSAEARFREAMTLRGEPARAAAAYNLGNRAMRAKSYERAAGYYKEALRARPTDLEAKRNLEEAIRQLRKGQPQKQQKPSPSPEGGPNQPPPQSGASSRPPTPPTPRGSPGEFTKEEAERWLQALESERRARRQEGKGQPETETGQRDW